MMHRTYGLQIFNLYKKVSISRNKNLSKWNNVKKYEMVKKGKKTEKKLLNTTGIVTCFTQFSYRNEQRNVTLNISGPLSIFFNLTLIIEILL